MAANLLLVEDVVPVAEDLGARLRRLGFGVAGIATSGEEALQLARQCRPALALMDIHLDPGMDGIDAAIALRRELDVPVIFLTAFSDAATLERAKQASPYGYMLKPFEDRELLVGIEVALHKHAADRELAHARQTIERLNADLERRVASRTAELETALSELETVARVVAHHLRGPVRALEGYADVLTGCLGCTEPSMQRLPRAITAESRQMANLIGDLLDFIDLRQAKCELTVLDMEALAHAAMARLWPSHPEALEFHVEPLLPCLADRALATRVMEELLSNALKFSRGRPVRRITLNCRPDDPAHVVYTLRDNGVGFDKAYAGKLFELFGRLHASGEFEGTGAGLALARRAAERLGGTLWASVPPEGGAMFHLKLRRIA